MANQRSYGAIVESDFREKRACKIVQKLIISSQSVSRTIFRHKQLGSLNDRPPLILLRYPWSTATKMATRLYSVLQIVQFNVNSH